MIPLEQQVAPLEESKRLKTLGMPQDTLFAWYREGGPKTGTDEARCNSCHDWQESEYGPTTDKYICAAPTVAELGEMLPAAHYSMRGAPDSEMGAGWFASDGGPTASATEAQARARLLIALVERGVVKWESA